MSVGALGENGSIASARPRLPSERAAELPALGRDAFLGKSRRAPSRDKTWWQLSPAERRVRDAQDAKAIQRKALITGIAGAGIGAAGAIVAAGATGALASAGSLAVAFGGSVVILAAAAWGTAALVRLLSSR
jgi:hypothetical protein